jgi:hypothetical protein
MAIEIKQLLIKVAVEDDAPEPTPDWESLANVKAEVLEECRRLIKETMSDRGLR